MVSHGDAHLKIPGLTGVEAYLTWLFQDLSGRSPIAWPCLTRATRAQLFKDFKDESGKIWGLDPLGSRCVDIAFDANLDNLRGVYQLCIIPDSLAALASSHSSPRFSSFHQSVQERCKPPESLPASDFPLRSSRFPPELASCSMSFYDNQLTTHQMHQIHEMLSDWWLRLSSPHSSLCAQGWPVRKQWSLKRFKSLLRSANAFFFPW